MGPKVCPERSETNYQYAKRNITYRLMCIVKGFESINVIFTQRVLYVVCSKIIRIGIVVVVHWVGCVCNQSWYVRTCLSNSWYKLQVAAFALLAVGGRGSNMCVCIVAIFTKVPNNTFASWFVLKSEKLQRKRINYCSKHTVKMQWVVHKCLTGSVDLQRVEPLLKATPTGDNRQHREMRKWLVKLEQSFAITWDWQYETQQITVGSLWAHAMQF